MSTEEAAAYLGVVLRTLYPLIDVEGLPAYKLGRVIRLRRGSSKRGSRSTGSSPATSTHLHPLGVVELKAQSQRRRQKG